MTITGRIYLLGSILCMLTIASMANAQGDTRRDSTVAVQAVGKGSARDSFYAVQAEPGKVSNKLPETAARKKRSDPSKAAIRSAILPGLGQAYNKKYWKIPIVYGALAVPTATFIYNKNWYDKTREAYSIKYYNDTNKVTPDLPTDDMDPQLVPLSTESTRLYRNEFRKNMDLSILAFLIIWGLQVADAAVDAHLKPFNVNDNLSLQLRPGAPGAGQPLGIGLQLNFSRNGHARMTTITR
jgi:hypothetical protein